MTLAELTAEMLRLSRMLDKGLEAMRDQAVEYADAEQEYRRAKAAAYAALAGDKRTVAEKDADVNGQTAALRRRRDLAEAMKQAALESVRSRRGQLSAVQTLANAHREEAGLARTGPEQ